MNTVPSLLLICLSAVQASPRGSANYSVPTDSNDAGGRRNTSASYTNDSSLGGITGTSTTAAPPQSTKHGYIGQLYEPASLQIIASPTTIDETTTRQLGVALLLDDDSLLAVSPTSVSWSVASGPLTGIDTDGLATADIVYQDTPATAQGSYAGLIGELGLTVLNVNLDDYGSYAGDGLDDAWQFQHFGLDNPDAAPLLDPDGDGQNNTFEFTAGLIPTNPLSRFLLSIEPVPGEPEQRKLIFSPRFNDRTYLVKSKIDLTPGLWLSLTSSTTVDALEARTVTDLDATGGKKFYRVEITRP